MKYLLKNANVYLKGKFEKVSVLVENGVIVDILSSDADLDGVTVFNFTNSFIFPGLIDVHVHLREPGFSFKETVLSGTKAAARGGYTTVCSMPNLNPVPDCYDNLKLQLDAIEKDAVINVVPYGSITVGQKGEQLADMDSMNDYVVSFSDDGRGVQNVGMMAAAMEKAKSLGKIITAHCEDNSLLFGGYIHDGEYCKAHGHKGICSESEWGPVQRDLELSMVNGCPYHVCHISAKETVEVIRNAKQNGVDVTCETGPHYLVLCDEDLQEDGRFKMNPPLRAKDDKEALIKGILDGTIDMIATDHAPHTAEEKSKGLAGSLMGVVGLETAVSVLYTHLVKKGIITLEKLVELMHDNPSKRFNIGSDIEVGAKADLTVFNFDEEYEINPDDFVSKGKSTPFKGMKVYGKCLMTMCGGNIVWQEEEND
ncbi:MAG: dihydroorotase [Clostridia bacterium]|nr:dihydroorotase [Clostridia bacterium]